MSLNPVELLGLTPALRMGGSGIRVIEGEKIPRRTQRHGRKASPESIKRANERYRAKDPERRKAQMNAANRRRYWKDPDKSRKTAREYQRKHRRSKVDHTPQSWAARLAQNIAAKRQRDKDPAYRAARLAKMRVYYQAKKARSK